MKTIRDIAISLLNCDGIQQKEGLDFLVSAFRAPDILNMLANSKMPEYTLTRNYGASSPISAIKEIRSVLGLFLKEAKDVVDGIRFLTSEEHSKLQKSRDILAGYGFNLTAVSK